MRIKDEEYPVLVRWISEELKKSTSCQILDFVCGWYVPGLSLLEAHTANEVLSKCMDLINDSEPKA